MPMLVGTLLVLMIGGAPPALAYEYDEASAVSHRSAAPAAVNATPIAQRPGLAGVVERESTAGPRSSTSSISLRLAAKEGTLLPRIAGGAPTEAELQDLSNAARDIANGHAFDSHMGEFPGISTRQEFTLTNASMELGPNNHAR
ncbi:MAG: hypothetical protein M3065_05655 [Actinomycetota bacterium]|nr:hypothetical protein [Actinomycetota bacterium]